MHIEKVKYRKKSFLILSYKKIKSRLKKSNAGYIMLNADIKSLNTDKY